MKQMLPADFSAKCVEAMKALYGPPMTADELSRYNALRAREMARAEVRRNPSPQLLLENLQ